MNRWRCCVSRSDVSSSPATWFSHKGIPVRNLWFLLVHASALADLLDSYQGGIDSGAEIPDLLGVLLAESVERRLHRGLGRGYVERAASLTRVRGRIDWLATETRQQLLRGRIACRFQDLTFDRPRNRLARAALLALAGRVRSRKVASRLKDADRALESWGVGTHRPSKAALLGDLPSRREQDDRLMVEVAQLALDLVLPTEAEDKSTLTRLSRDEKLLRKIFEAGIAGYLRHHLHGREGWKVRPQRSLSWQSEDATPGIAAIFPGMITDIVLEQGDRRIVVDTKFTDMLTPRRHGGEALKSAHIYQLYTYLRSQEGSSIRADQAEGLLLYPSIGQERDEELTIQGHRLRFASIDLTRSTQDFGEALRSIVCG